MATIFVYTTAVTITNDSQGLPITLILIAAIVAASLMKIRDMTGTRPNPPTHSPGAAPWTRGEW